MVKNQRTNSPIDDPQPWEAPDVIPAEQKKVVSDYEKLIKSKKYPLIHKYWEGRIEHYRRYLPSGETITGLTKAERATAWENAVVIISELEAFAARLQSEVNINDPIKGALK